MMKSKGLFLSVLVLLAVAGGGCKEKTAQEKRQEAQTEFRRLVIKKDPMQVVNAVGRPQKKWRRDTHNFYYKYQIAADKATGKALSATVVFKDRQAETVRFKQVRLVEAE